MSYKVKRDGSDLATLMSVSNFPNEGLYFASFADLGAFLAASDADTVSVEKHDYIKNVGDLKKEVLSRNMAIYVSTETRQLHEKIQLNFNEGYNAGLE